MLDGLLAHFLKPPKKLRDHFKRPKNLKIFRKNQRNAGTKPAARQLLCQLRQEMLLELLQEADSYAKPSSDSPDLSAGKTSG